MKKTLFLFLSIFYCTVAWSSQNFPVITHFGSNVPSQVKIRFKELLSNITSEGTAVVFTVGNNFFTRMFIEKSELDELGPEGFIIKTARMKEVLVIAVDGNSGHFKDVTLKGNLGITFGMYAALEQLGFSFLHPLDPIIPKKLKIPTEPIIRFEKPYWPVRAFHLHTAHPLELTHLLNGWGPKGPQDQAGWESMLPLWERYLEWMIANRQNRLEWVLMKSPTYPDFSDSAILQQRLKYLVSRAHKWGIAVGIDVPIAIEQQNARRLINVFGNLSTEITQIQQGVDWLDQADFDYYSTEVGFSEFESPDDKVMLEWINAFSRYVKEKYKKTLTVKCHVSTGQVAEKYPDPQTGKPINFNFLVHYTDKNVAAVVHSVQLYGLDDQAPTYGNKDFSDMRRFLNLELGNRPVLWYPETAYWVSYDIDVPLFLPLYAERRLHDLRILAREQVGKKKTMDGQLVFSSGWEWGYWLNDVIAARSAWDPHLSEVSDNEALLKILKESLGIFGSSTDLVAQALKNVVSNQKDLLIDGVIDFKKPVQIEELNGISYLAGTETWDEISFYLSDLTRFHINATQPRKMEMYSVGWDFHKSKINYHSHVRPLLFQMEKDFGFQLEKLKTLSLLIPQEGQSVWNEILDGQSMNYLRAKEVAALYRYTRGRNIKDLEIARVSVEEALSVSKKRQKLYRGVPELVNEWGPNPTSYRYGYLWTVKSLYYWIRDLNKAVSRPVNPCFMNIINPGDTALAGGSKNTWYLRLLRLVSIFPGLVSPIECLNPPLEEPHF